MKKTIIFVLLSLVALSLSASALSSIPDGLGMPCTFGYFRLSADGANWVTIVSQETTIDILNPTIVSTTGAQVNIVPPPAGTYRYLGMSVTAINLTMAGQTPRDILEVLNVQSGGQTNMNAVTMEIIPITYSGSGDFNLNIYFPPENMSGTSFANYFPIDGPLFSFTGGVVSSEAATIIVSIPSGVAIGESLFAGAFQTLGQDAGPSFSAPLTNAGNGSASGTLHLPAGNWQIMAMGSQGTFGPGGPGEGAKGYTINGAAPWQNSTSPIAVSGGGSATATLSYAFTITSSMDAGGSGQMPQGSSSIALSLQASPDAVSLSQPAQLMVYAFTSEAQAGPPDYFLGAQEVSTGSFTSATFEASSLGAGTYSIVAFLNISGQSEPQVNVDYIGSWNISGEAGQSTPVILGAGQSLSLSAPLYLRLYTSQ